MFSKEYYVHEGIFDDFDNSLQEQLFLILESYDPMFGNYGFHVKVTLISQTRLPFALCQSEFF